MTKASGLSYWNYRAFLDRDGVGGENRFRGKCQSLGTPSWKCLLDLPAALNDHSCICEFRDKFLA